MKPVAPPLTEANGPVEEDASIKSEILRLCDERERDGRITLPAPPSPETLRAATPFPPASEREPVSRDTIPTPPPSASRKRLDAGHDDTVPSTIPGPPRLPRIAGL